eukprot:g50088.t1
MEPHDPMTAGVDEWTILPTSFAKQQPDGKWVVSLKDISSRDCVVDELGCIPTELEAQPHQDTSLTKISPLFETASIIRSNSFLLHLLHNASKTWTCFYDDIHVFFSQRHSSKSFPSNVMAQRRCIILDSEDVGTRKVSTTV